jgi:hypothetical protein
MKSSAGVKLSQQLYCGVWLGYEDMSIRIFHTSDMQSMIAPNYTWFFPTVFPFSTPMNMTPKIHGTTSCLGPNFKLVPA